MTETIRTPDERFKDFPGFPFVPRYSGDLPGYEGLRMQDPVLGPPVSIEKCSESQRRIIHQTRSTGGMPSRAVRDRHLWGKPCRSVQR